MAEQKRVKRQKRKWQPKRSDRKATKRRLDEAEENARDLRRRLDETEGAGVPFTLFQGESDAARER